MFELPSSLKYYILFVSAWALAIVVFCFTTEPIATPSYLSACLFLLIAILTESKVVSYSQSYSQTVTTAIVVASAFLFDPLVVIFIAIIGTTICDVFAHKAWFKICFNISYKIITYGSLAISIHSTNVSVFNIETISDTLSIFYSFVVYMCLSTVLMGLLFSLVKGKGLRGSWQEIVDIFNPYDLALFPYGLALAWLWHSSVWYFFVALIPLIAIQHSFAVHAGLIKEQEASTRLMEQQRQIHEATTTLLSASDIHTQLDTMMRYIMGMFPVEHTSVVLWGEGEEIEQVVSRGICTPALPLTEWSDKLRRVCETRRLVQLDHEFVRQAMAGQPVLIVPLVTPDDVVGCVVLVTNPLFSVDEQAERLIKTFAAQAALAIYQARLITKLRSSQVRVVQSERLAAIGTLAAGVAHEFNNLLAGISGIAQLALLDDEADQREALDTVAKSAQNGGSITRGLLTFARHLEPKREPADLRNAIDPVLSMLQAEFRRMNITVERRIQPVAPLLCDIGTLAQVMLNLVTNAIDAMHGNGGTLTIDLAEENDHVRLVVSDTGSGIPAHVRDHIFEPFVSTKTSNDGKLHGGSGLGLAISYGIIAEHGGTIEVDTEEGRGTSMVIRLPLATSPTTACSPIIVPRQVQPLRMIVVDDEPLVAKSLYGMLTKEGHSAQWFTEPVKALEAISRAPVDIIFADLTMPEMDGVTLLQQVKQHAPQVVQVVVTGQADARQLEQVRSLGVNAVIEKPFSLDKVRVIVGTLQASPA